MWLTVYIPQLFQVRSIALDAWTPEMAALLPRLGGSNRLLLARSTSDEEPPAPSADRAAREVWIRKKYEARRFVDRY